MSAAAITAIASRGFLGKGREQPISRFGEFGEVEQSRLDLRLFKMVRGHIAAGGGELGVRGPELAEIIGNPAALGMSRAQDLVGQLLDAIHGLARQIGNRAGE